MQTGEAQALSSGPLALLWDEAVHQRGSIEFGKTGALTTHLRLTGFATQPFVALSEFFSTFAHAASGALLAGCRRGLQFIEGLSAER